MHLGESLCTLTVATECSGTLGICFKECKTIAIRCRQALRELVDFLIKPTDRPLILHIYPCTFTTIIQESIQLSLPAYNVPVVPLLIFPK